MGAIINMKESPLRKKSDDIVQKWHKIVERISLALASTPEELFPEAIRQAKIGPETRLRLEMSVDEFGKLGSPMPPMLIADGNPETEFQVKEAGEALDRALKTLTPREERVLNLRHGREDGKEHTFEEIGDIFDVTRERVRQIEARALRKMRHYSCKRLLKGVQLPGYIPEPDKK